MTIIQALCEISKYKKIVLSKPCTKYFKKATLQSFENGFRLEKITDTQAFHQNMTTEQTQEFCENAMQNLFLQLNAWDDNYEYMILVSQKGKISCKRIKTTVALQNVQHDRKKNYIIEQGRVIAPLVDMGIFTKDGNVVNSMYDKFKQINRFVEIIDDVYKSENCEKLNIIDFGCGKSYLTFVLYHYFTEIRKINVTITGLDLKQAVIDNCNSSAKKYGYTNLHFEIGDIYKYTTKNPVDMVISLHACDVATDYTLFNAIKWNCKTIFSVPCCQHELNSQIKSEDLSILNRYGIVQERTAALMTDAIRGNLLEACGYKTQLLEFIDLSHTPKNILIRGKKRPVTAESRAKALKEVNALMQEFNLNPTLYRLLLESGHV